MTDNTTDCEVANRKCWQTPANARTSRAAGVASVFRARFVTGSGPGSRHCVILSLLALVVLVLSPPAGMAQSSPTRLSGAQMRVGTRMSTSTTDTITQSDCGKLVSYSTTGDIAVTLPLADSLLPGCWVDIQNLGSGTLTVTPTTSAIDGQTSVAFGSGDGGRIVDAADQYLTLHNQGGVAAAYSADETTIDLIGNTLSVNTAAIASRLTSAQAIDTTCAITSGSSSTYTGAVRGNALITYTDGMRLLAEIDTTTGGGPITMDCGAGPMSVYQNDGVSNPTTTQWAGGMQVLVSYDASLASAAGGWRILSGGASAGSAPSNVSTGTSGWFLFGGYPAYDGGGTGFNLVAAAGGPNSGGSFKFTADSTSLSSLSYNVLAPGQAGSGVIYGIYSISAGAPGTLLCAAVGSGTDVTTTGVKTLAWTAGPSVAAGVCSGLVIGSGYLFLLSSDSTALKIGSCGYELGPLSLMAARNPAYAGYLNVMTTGSGAGLTFINSFGAFNAGSSTFPPMIYFGSV